MNIKEVLENDFSMDLNDFQLILEDFDSKFNNYIKNSKDRNILAFFNFFNEEFNELKKIYEKINCLQVLKDDDENNSMIFSYYQNFVNSIFSSKSFYDFVKNSTFQNNKEKKLKKHILNYFSYYGYHLDNKDQLYNIFDNLNDLEQSFEKNVYNFKMNNIIKFTQEELVYFEKDKIKELFIEKDGQYYFIINDFSCFEFICYCNNEEYRKKIFYLYNKSCSFYFPEYDNTQLMGNILDKRLELASLNNKKTYFDFTHKKDDFVNKSFIYKFLNSIKKELTPKLKEKIGKIREFIKKEYDIDNIKREDYFYFAHKYNEYLLDKKNNLSSDCFFHIDDIIAALNDNILRLFNLKIKKIDDFLFNDKEYSLYNLYEDNNLKTKLMIEFSHDFENSEYHYVFSYPLVPDEIGLSLVSIYKKNGLLNIKDLKSFLHEIGHFIDFSINEDYKFLPYLLDYRINNEFCSMFFEKFIYDRNFLFECKGQVNNKPIKEEELNSIYISVNNQFLDNTAELLILSLFDFYIHDGFKGNLKDLFDDIFDDVHPLGAFKESYLVNRDTFIFGYSSFNYAAHLYTYLLADYYSTFIYKTLHLENKNIHKFKDILFKKYDIIEIDNFIKSSFKDDFNSKNYFNFYEIDT